MDWHSIIDMIIVSCPLAEVIALVFKVEQNQHYSPFMLSLSAFSPHRMPALARSWSNPHCAAATAQTTGFDSNLELSYCFCCCCCCCCHLKSNQNIWSYLRNLRSLSCVSCFEFLTCRSFVFVCLFACFFYSLSLFFFCLHRRRQNKL